MRWGDVWGGLAGLGWGAVVGFSWDGVAEVGWEVAEGLGSGWGLLW